MGLRNFILTWLNIKSELTKLDNRITMVKDSNINARVELKENILDLQTNSHPPVDFTPYIERIDRLEKELREAKKAIDAVSKALAKLQVFHIEAHGELPSD